MGLYEVESLITFRRDKGSTIAGLEQRFGEAPAKIIWRFLIEGEEHLNEKTEGTGGHRAGQERYR